MTQNLPRAPKLVQNTCIATAALIESAQRVFLYRTSSPLHWIDLCTVIESIILYDKIAFPCVYNDYAEPLVKPLNEAGILDIWYPESCIMGNICLQSKDEAWQNSDADALRLLRGWPDEIDEQYEKLSDFSKDAVDGIAAGFAEAVLSKENDELSVLLWGKLARGSKASGFEDAALAWLARGVSEIRSLSPKERAEFSVPHKGVRDTYNHYAKYLRDLANDNKSILVKSVIEEAFFDPNSLESAARDTLYFLLRDGYDEKVFQRVNSSVGKFVRLVPAPPFSAIALSRCQYRDGLHDVIRIAIEMRTEFKSYIRFIRQQRSVLLEQLTSQTGSLAVKLEKMESEFSEGLRKAFARTEMELSPKVIPMFDAVKALPDLGLSIHSGNYAAVFEKAAPVIYKALQSWYFMSYCGVYGIVGNFPQVSQLSALSSNLTGKRFDRAACDVLQASSELITKNYGLMRIPSSPLSQT